MILHGIKTADMTNYKFAIKVQLLSIYFTSIRRIPQSIYIQSILNNLELVGINNLISEPRLASSLGTCEEMIRNTAGWKRKNLIHHPLDPMKHLHTMTVCYRVKIKLLCNT